MDPMGLELLRLHMFLYNSMFSGQGAMLCCIQLQLTLNFGYCRRHGGGRVTRHINVHFRNLNWRYLPYIRPILEAYVREYHHKIWPYMVQYLHFRILEFPLTKAPVVRRGTKAFAEDGPFFCRFPQDFYEHPPQKLTNKPVIDDLVT